MTAHRADTPVVRTPERTTRGKHVGPRLRGAALAEAHARYDAVQASLLTARAAGEHAQLIAMTGNEGRRQYDRDLDDAYALPVTYPTDPCGSCGVSGGMHIRHCRGIS